jgi:hypothetical protein
MTAGRVVSPALSPDREKTLTRGLAAMVDVDENLIDGELLLCIGFVEPFLRKRRLKR